MDIRLLSQLEDDYHYDYDVLKNIWDKIIEKSIEYSNTINTINKMKKTELLEKCKNLMKEKQKYLVKDLKILLINDVGIIDKDMDFASELSKIPTTTNEMNNVSTLLNIIKLNNLKPNVEENNTCVLEHLNEITFENLSKKKVKELKEYCKERTLLVSGTKLVLVNRILDFEKNGKPEKIKSQKKSLKIENKLCILDFKTNNSTNAIKIELNDSGFYNVSMSGNDEFNSLKLIYDKVKSRIIGRMFDSCIVELDLKCIDVCREYNILYELPVNLSR
jgi:hypothetical protein